MHPERVRRRPLLQLAVRSTHGMDMAFIIIIRLIFVSCHVPFSVLAIHQNEGSRLFNLLVFFSLDHFVECFYHSFSLYPALVVFEQSEADFVCGLSRSRTLAFVRGPECIWPFVDSTLLSNSSQRKETHGLYGTAACGE